MASSERLDPGPAALRSLDPDLERTAVAATGALAARPWRAIEAQHVVATRKLVDSEADHELLEAMIEAHKPPSLDPGGAGALHYLLSTPFRYPPLRHGSRFGRRIERGIWYGAETPEACFAEAAYYRLVFLEGSAADLAPLSVELSVFRTRLVTERGVDLLSGRFTGARARLASPTDYSLSQSLGSWARGAGVEVLRYPSARLAGGANYAVLAPEAFAERKPAAPQTWHCVATREAVEMTRRSYFERASYRFVRAAFLVNGMLPLPAL